MIQEIVYNLKNNFAYLVQTIVFNNPEAVALKLNNVYSGNYETPESMIDVILQFAQAGQQQIINEILQVPFLYENATPELNEAIRILNKEANVKVNSGATLLRTDGEQTGTGEGGGFSSWSGGLFEMIGVIGSSALEGNNNGGSGVSGVGTPAPVKKDNTLWYVLGGVVVLIILIVLILAFTGKKK